MAKIRSPIAGTILELNAQPGEEAGTDPKIPLAKIVNLSALQVLSTLDPATGAAVKPGMVAKLEFLELPGKGFVGRVASITTQTAEKIGGLIKQQKHAVIIDFKNVDEQVRPNMHPSGTIVTGVAKNVLVAPNEAIFHDTAGRALVRVKRGYNWVEAPVEVGVSDGRFTQIISGLKDNDVIAVTPNVLHATAR